MRLTMTADEFDRRKDEFDPDRFDFRWDRDFATVDVVPLAWWDDASYAAYQCGD